VKPEIIQKLEEIVGKDWVITRKEAVEAYLEDQTETPIRPKPAPDVVVVKPATTEEVSKILKLANEEKIPVFPRGGGTGLVGGCIPTQSGIVLSMERMDKIEIDEENLMAVCEAGVTLENLIRTAEKAGFTFPPHPGDEGAHVGGMVATNAGGVRAVKYGVMRNYVKGLEVVLPTGEVLNLGGKLIKNVAGYDLMHLMIGSEGTLGVITKVILRLYPKPKASMTMIVAFNNRHDAIRSVPRILQAGITPLAIEYVERVSVERASKEIGIPWPAKKGNAFLIVILTADSQDELYAMADRVDEICRANNAVETLVAERKREQEDILKIRSQVGETGEHTLDVLDIAVPPANLAKLMDELDAIAKRYNAQMPVYGHAGDGNLHPEILDDKAGGIRPELLDEFRREIYKAVVALGGTITAEHGVGRVRIKFLDQYLSKKEIEIMRAIKKIFDPNNILNPGAVIPP